MGKRISRAAATAPPPPPPSYASRQRAPTGPAYNSTIPALTPPADPETGAAMLARYQHNVRSWETRQASRNRAYTTTDLSRLSLGGVPDDHVFVSADVSYEIILLLIIRNSHKYRHGSLSTPTSTWPSREATNMVRVSSAPTPRYSFLFLRPISYPSTPVLLSVSCSCCSFERIVYLSS
jgi:hypothetical protein